MSKRSSTSSILIVIGVVAVLAVAFRFFGGALYHMFLAMHGRG
jgi:hypothetical protein